MPMLADAVDAVIGVDTHTDTHTAAVVSPLGACLAVVQVTADAAGYAQLMEDVRKAPMSRRRLPKYSQGSSFVQVGWVLRPGQEQAAMKMLCRLLSGAVLAACLVSAGRAQF